jgi:hypothetical protein
MVLDDSHFTGTERTNCVVREADDEAGEVRHIPGNVERMNLSTPIGEKLVSAGKAAQDQRDGIRRTASFDNVVIPQHLPACADNSEKRADLLGRKRAY